MDNQNVYTNLRETAAKVLPPGSSNGFLSKR